MFRFKSKKQKLIEETYSLDYSFVKWLNTHLKVYLEYALKYIDLEFHKFNYKGKEYTQLQMINKLIEITDYLVDEDTYFNWEEKTFEYIKEMLDIYALIFNSLSW